MVFGLIFALIFGWAQDDKSAQPLVSATDPAYLACSVWNGHEWTKPTARLARTPVAQSSSGLRAFGEVIVSVEGADCHNTTKLYVTSGTNSSFKVVYSTSEKQMADGNGMRLIGWSPAGDKLLAQLNYWRYESEGYGHLALMYDSTGESASEIKALDKALLVRFGQDCEFEFELGKWKTNDQLFVKISKSLEDETYEQHFCVDRPVTLVFDLHKGTLQPMQRHRQNAGVRAQ